MKIVVRSLGLIVSLSFGLIGCGGGGGGGAALTGTFTSTIQWPALTRSATAPRTARSCKITYQLPTFQVVNSVTVNRDPTRSEAYSQVVTSPAMDSGSYIISPAFFLLADAQGAMVATGLSSSVDLLPGAENPSPTISMNSLLTNIAVVSVSPVTFGGPPLQLQATGQQAFTPLVLPVGSVAWQLISGPGTLTPAGLLTPSGPGTFVVRAEVDGLLSPNTSIQVLAP